MVKKSNIEMKNNMYNILFAEHESTIDDDGIISNIEGVVISYGLGCGITVAHLLGLDMVH